MVVRTFVAALAIHMEAINPSDEKTFFLIPYIISAHEIPPDESGTKGKKQTKMRVTLSGFDEVILPRLSSCNTFIFLLHHLNIIDEEEFPHYVVVTVEKGQDFWMAVVRGDDAYGSLESDIWKESVHFIAKQLGVTNRSNVVFRTENSAKKPKPSPFKVFAEKIVMQDDGELDDNVSCGPYCCRFLLLLYDSLGRVDPVIIPNITSKDLPPRTKTGMIFVLMKLIGPLARIMDVNESYNMVNVLKGDCAGAIGFESYEMGPEKYSMKKLNVSLLSLSDDLISTLLLESGCPCDRTHYSGAPYIQCSNCYKVYHVECFFTFIKHLKGEIVHCQGCQKEVGLDTDMLLIPPKRQIPKNWKDFINDGVLLLDFLKQGDWSKNQRNDVRKKWVNFLGRRYGNSWAFVSPYNQNDSDNMAIMK